MGRGKFDRLAEKFRGRQREKSNKVNRKRKQAQVHARWRERYGKQADVAAELMREEGVHPDEYEMGMDVGSMDFTVIEKRIMSSIGGLGTVGVTTTSNSSWGWLVASPAKFYKGGQILKMTCSGRITTD